MESSLHGVWRIRLGLTDEARPSGLAKHPSLTRRFLFIARYKAHPEMLTNDRVGQTH